MSFVAASLGDKGGGLVNSHAGVASTMAATRGDLVEDDRLIERSRRGDLDAFDQLVASYYRPIYAVARRLSPSPDDAADIAQEVFIAAWRQLGQFHGHASFRTWLHAIALRQCAASARCARGRPASLDDPEAPEPSSSAEPSMQALLERREQDAALHAAIHTLPRAQREAVVLHYFGGLTCAEAATAMGISPGAVMTHLFRARRSLRAALGEL
jgi:RNA polymerase sigma-70 factor (ECF subfamily)